MIKRGTTQSDKNFFTRCYNICKAHHSMNGMPIIVRKVIYCVPQNDVTDIVRTLCKQILKMLLSPF